MASTRSYKEKDVKRLIASAGGRCSYRHGNEICKKLLISGNSVIGEKAHIRAFSDKGPRHEKNYDQSKLNTYENLMWLCPTHHTVLDKMDDLETFTTEYLTTMKEKHELEISEGNYSNGAVIYDTVIHDYTFLSTMFENVDINKLYSSTLEIPNYLGTDFSNLLDFIDSFEQEHESFELKDLYLDKLFRQMYKQACNVNQFIHKNYFTEAYTENISPINLISLQIHKNKINKIKLIEPKLKKLTCEYQEFVEAFLNAIRSRYPEMLFQKPELLLSNT